MHLLEDNWLEVMTNINQFPFRTSEIKQLNKEVLLSKISFKYNLQGKETYYNGQQEVTLQHGQYLLAINQQFCEVNINEKFQTDLGICIDIDEMLLKEALQSHDEYELSSGFRSLENYFFCESFFHAYPTNELFQKYMQTLYVALQDKSKIDLQETTFDFLNSFLQQQTPYIEAYQKIPAIRISTRKELYAKMLLAKQYLSDVVFTNCTMKTIASMLYMSEYRFYHLFKATFQISPNRYLQQLRMQEALRMYQVKKLSWTEIAHALQFADIQSFSKAFKKHYRVAPSLFILNE